MKGISVICAGFRIFLVGMIIFAWCERIARHMGCTAGWQGKP